MKFSYRPTTTFWPPLISFTMPIPVTTAVKDFCIKPIPLNEFMKERRLVSTYSVCLFRFQCNSIEFRSHKAYLRTPFSAATALAIDTLFVSSYILYPSAALNDETKN